MEIFIALMFWFFCGLLSVYVLGRTSRSMSSNDGPYTSAFFLGPIFLISIGIVFVALYIQYLLSDMPNPLIWLYKKGLGSVDKEKK